MFDPSLEELPNSSFPNGVGGSKLPTSNQDLAHTPGGAALPTSPIGVDKPISTSEVNDTDIILLLRC